MWKPKSAEPPNPDTIQLCDFEDAFEAFYWLGYFSKRLDRNCSVAQESGALSAGKKQPLSEVADFVCFDTETSGLSAADCAIQVAVGFFDVDGRPLGYYDRLWKLPEGVRVSGASYRIHKISNKRLEREGQEAAPEVRKVLKILRTMRERGKLIIAHNASFDCRMLAQTAKHHGIEDWDVERGDVFCTMHAAKERCGLTSSKTGRPKAPSNVELYKCLTGTAPTGILHDALTDVRVTARSYVEGKKLGWWQKEHSNSLSSSG